MVMNCAICKQEIKKKDNYIDLKEFVVGEKTLQTYYHQKCFRDRISGKDNPDKVMLRQLMGRVNNMMGKVEEKYELT